jgi:predicted dehydrogenase
LYGDNGSLRAMPDYCEVYGNDGEPQRIAYPDAALSDYALELEAFADHVAERRDGPTTGRSERRSLAIIQAGYESAASGLPVDLAQRFGVSYGD